MMEAEVFNQPDPHDVKISFEMSQMELIYGGEHGAAKMCQLYFYNKYWNIDGKKAKPLTQEEWNRDTKIIIKARRKG